MEKKVKEEIKNNTEEELVINIEDRKKLNIYEKMSLATDMIQRVAKNLNVGTGKSQYKAVGEADVLSAVKPIEIKLGIYSYPLERKIIDTNVLTTTSEYDGKTTERNQLFMRVETIYRFINIDNPEQFINIITYGDGIDTGDKAPGKAMTYGDKYALLKAYKIETGEDPDANASETLKGVQKMNGQKQQLQQDRNNLPISQGQLGTLQKWSKDGEYLDKMLEEISNITGNKIEKFEDLKMLEASKYIQFKIDEMNANKARIENGGNN